MIPTGLGRRTGGRHDLASNFCSQPRPRSASRDAGCRLPASAQQAAAVAIDNDDIGGVVTGPNGPEAGVWVIAETTDLPTRYIKSVVTDDQGRYLIPDLPQGELRGVRARLRPRGLRQGQRASRAGSSTSPHAARDARRRPPKSIRRSTGIRCSRCRRSTNSRSATSRARPNGSTSSRPTAATPATRSATRRRARSRRCSPT